MPPFGTDEILWYNNGVFGQLGYAVPNFGDDPSTLNFGVHRLVSAIGQNLFAIMNHSDADLTVPPSINTLTRVNKLILRARSILQSRDRAPGEFAMEPTHASPVEQVFLIYPCPYFKVRNPWLKEWAGYAMLGLSEAMQHTENRNAFEITQEFSGIVGQYFHRIYRLMATELFGVPAEDAKKLDFTLTDAQLAAYNPTKFFTSTEMVDTVPPLQFVPTEDDLRVLAAGIPATHLVGLARYPSAAAMATGQQASLGTATAQPATATGTAASAGSFATPPGP